MSFLHWLIPVSSYVATEKARQVLELEQGWYNGQTNNVGQPEGVGSMHYLNGDRYHGRWKAGNRRGKGTLFYKNGDLYFGDFRGIPHGSGKLSLGSLDEYKGDFVDGTMGGFGKMTYKVI